MDRRQSLKHLSAAAMLASMAPAWSQQAWSPNAPVKMIVPFTPGGPFDFYARTIGDRLSPRIGQPVIIDYKPGAGQAIGADFVRRQPPDGLTLFIMSTSFMLNSVLTKVPFDPLQDFTPLLQFGDGDVIIAVNTANTKFRNPQQFLDWARTEKKNAFYGLPNRGGAGHMVGELINKRAGVELQAVPYKGSAPMMTDLLAGQINVVIETMATVKPFLDSGKVAIIASCSSQRSATLPEVPTLAETVLPGFDLRAWYGLMLPPNAPAPIVARYNTEINAILKDPAVVELFARYGINTTRTTPEGFKKALKEYFDLYTQIARDAKITI